MRASFDFRAFGRTPPAIALIIAAFLIVIAVALAIGGFPELTAPIWAYVAVFIIVAVLLQALYIYAIKR